MNDVTLEQLAALSDNLNKASDALSNQIALVEEALNSLKLGVWASVEISRYTDDESFTVNGSPEPATCIERLAYGKRRGKWGLLYSLDYPEFPEPEFDSVVFLRDAPRMERMAAVDKIPDLIRELERKSREVTQKASEQATKVGAVAAALRKAGTKRDR